MEPVAPSENRAESNRSARWGRPPPKKKESTQQGWGSPHDCCCVGKWFSNKRAYAAHMGFSNCAATKMPDCSWSPRTRWALNTGIVA